MERFEAARTRKIRKLSGWNVFCKSRLVGETCSPEENSNRVKRLSSEWKALSADEKCGFEVEAQHQEVLRAQLAFTPLSTGEAAKSTKGKTVLEEQVGRKACKRLSARRLQINDEQFAKHPIWSLPTCFCDSNLKPFSVGTLSFLVFKPSKLDCSLSSQATLSGYVRNLYVVIKYYD